MNSSIAGAPECVAARRAVLKAYGPKVPVSLVLFGSRARGDAHEGSDWDFLVVLPASWERPSVPPQERPSRAVERTLDSLPGQLVEYTLDSLERGQGWCLFRRVLRDGVTLHGVEPGSIPFPEGMAARGAASMLAFAASHLSDASESAWRGLSAGQDEGYRMECGMEMAVSSSRIALSRAFDAWACREDRYGPNSKGLPLYAESVARGNDMPDGLADLMARAGRAFSEAGWDQADWCSNPDEATGLSVLGATRDFVAAVAEGTGGMAETERAELMAGLDDVAGVLSGDYVPLAERVRRGR